MYKFIPASEKYFDQIIPLLFETGYYEYGAIDNKLNLSAAEFNKVQTLQPYLKYTSVLINTDAAPGEEFAGFCITATRKQVAEVEKNIPNMLRDDPSFAQAIEKIVRFYSEEVSGRDLIALNAAVHPRYRGQGLYRLIQQYRQELAKQNHSSKIFLLVWQSNSAHKIFQQHYGLKYIGKIDCPDLPVPDKLLKGVFELG